MNSAAPTWVMKAVVQAKRGLDKKEIDRTNGLLSRSEFIDGLRKCRLSQPGRMLLTTYGDFSAFGGGMHAKMHFLCG